MNNADSSNFKRVVNLAYKLYHFIAKVFLYSILIILLLIAIGFICYFVDMYRNIQNGVTKSPLLNAYVIISPSMEPTIKVEDAVVVMRKEPEELAVKDIITFVSNDPRYSGLTITHRIVGIEKAANGQYYYRTKGDNNNTEDSSLVNYDNILGKVILKIPKIGYIQYILTRSYGWLLLVVVPCVGIIIFDIIKLIKAIKKNVKKPNEKKVKKDDFIELIDDPSVDQKLVENQEVINENQSSDDDLEII